jgi:hypothetical protein
LPIPDHLPDRTIKGSKTFTVTVLSGLTDDVQGSNSTIVKVYEISLVTYRTTSFDHLLQPL